MLTRLTAMSGRLRSSLFFLPMVCVLLGVVLAEIMLGIDAMVSDIDSRWTATVESARTVLTTIAGATLTFAGTAFSVSLLLLSLASSQYSPRVVHGMFRDPFNKRVMGLVIGTFTYCLIVLRAVRSSLEGTDEPIVPSVSILLAVVLTALLGLAVPLGDDAGSIRVAAVQGGGPQGTRFAEADTEPVLARHLAASAGIEPGSVDLVVWPENVVNIEGPFEEHPWAGRLRREATRVGAPILVGVVEGVGGTEFVNYVVVVNPDGSITGRFDKERRVPFGEYVPLRPLFETFAAGQLPPRDQIPGVGTAMVPTSAGDAAVAISWEVFFARRVREGVRAGGEFVTNPTNGSSYWLTQVQSQQIAQSQLRATESGRWLVQAAPTGFSAVVGPRGELLQRSDVGEAVVLEATIERLRSTTPAQATGDLIPMALAGGVVFSFLTAEWMRRRSEVPART